MTKVYDELIDFIASGGGPNAVAAFQPSVEARVRVSELLEREKIDALNAEERAELEHYTELEHLMRLAKARAQRLLAMW